MPLPIPSEPTSRRTAPARLDTRRTRGAETPAPITLSLGRAVDEVVRASDASSVSRPASAWEQGGRASIDKATQRHRRAILETGVGIYYGAKSDLRAAEKSEGKGARTRFVAAHAKEGADIKAISEGLELSSCIGWAMKHVRAAYAGAGKSERWKEIEAIVREDRQRGTTLARELEKDGWTTVLYAPDAAGGGDGHAKRGLTRGVYHGIPVHDRLIGLNAEGHDHPLARKLASAGFFFGLENSGSHTFVGSNGRVSEFHWRAHPDDVDAMSDAPAHRFLDTSGLLVFPPGSWRTEGKKVRRGGSSS